MLSVSHELLVPVPPPVYGRAQRQAATRLQTDALTLVTRLHLLALCHVAVRYAHWRRPLRSPTRVLAYCCSQPAIIMLGAAESARVLRAGSGTAAGPCSYVVPGTRR